jgi:hypothetical protein
LRARAEEIERLGISVLVLTFESRAMAERYARETELEWPLLIDASRAAYRDYGMRRGAAWEIWNPVWWGRYIELMVRGRRLHAPTGDVYQLGGDVLIDPVGRIALHRVERGPADRPPVEHLLEPVRREASHG